MKNYEDEEEEEEKEEEEEEEEGGGEEERKKKRKKKKKVLNFKWCSLHAGSGSMQPQKSLQIAIFFILVEGNYIVP